MHFDLPTLIAATTLAAVALAAPVLLVAFRSRDHAGLGLWGAGLVVNALSYPAFGLRAWGWTEASIILSNLLTALTLVLQTRALQEFRPASRPAAPPWSLWFLLVMNVIVAAVLVHDDRWRNLMVLLLQVALSLLFLREALGRGPDEPHLSGRLVLVGGITLLVALLVLRMALMATASQWDARFNVPVHVQSLTYFATLAVLLLNTIGFVLMQMEAALARQHALATRDALTGTYNRAALTEFLDVLGSQARRQHRPMAFLMLDIDHFKHVNDAHGHPAGDEVLREVARRIHKRMRRSDILTRYGGEEFLAILPFTDQAAALRIAEDIRQSVAAGAISTRVAQVAVTISVGVHAGVPTDGAAALQAMIALSDQALYSAKEGGRNRVECR